MPNAKVIFSAGAAFSLSCRAVALAKAGAFRIQPFLLRPARANIVQNAGLTPSCINVISSMAVTPFLRGLLHGADLRGRLFKMWDGPLHDPFKFKCLFVTFVACLL